MIVLDLPPNVEHYINQTASYQGLTVNELITKWATKDEKSSILLSDFVKELPNRTHLGDGIAIQKALRDEWD